MCFILNDILNRELIRLNFKFEEPVHTENTTTGDANQNGIIVDPDLNDYLVEEDNMEEGEFMAGEEDDEGAEGMDRCGMNGREVNEYKAGLHLADEKGIIEGRADP